MITILLTVSRADYLEKVISAIELQDINPIDINLLAIVDGADELYVRTRNLIMGTKYDQRLTVQSNNPGLPDRLHVPSRRMRIANNLNQARDLIQHTHGYVFCVEDDTTFGTHALQTLNDFATLHRSCGFVEGVEIGRWGIPYVGAWNADDIYECNELTSVTNMPKDTPVMKIDAGGLYCSLIRADLFKQHNFHSENGLGPDVNFGLEIRQLGYENYIDWSVPCSHYYNDMAETKIITPRDTTKVITLSKESEKKWRASY